MTWQETPVEERDLEKAAHLAADKRVPEAGGIFPLRISVRVRLGITI